VIDLFKPFKDHRFDVIAIHPPAVPYPIGKTWGLTEGMTIATNGGYDGSRLTLLSISQATQYLTPNGKFLLLLPHWSNTKKAYGMLSTHYRTIRKLSEKKVRFFPMTEGKPTRELAGHIERLTKNGIVEIIYKNEILYSRVSVIQAVK
jgi:methylase of polypeptide subunit release factors